MTRRPPEQVEMHGRAFTVVIEGPDDAARYSAHITESATGRTLTRTPVRGRSIEDARATAFDVIRNLVTIERLQAIIISTTAELAPGATVELSEDAEAIRADVSGGWTLTRPLALPRTDVTDPDADLEAWARYIQEHLAIYLRPVDRGS